MEVKGSRNSEAAERRLKNARGHLHCPDSIQDSSNEKPTLGSDVPNQAIVITSSKLKKRDAKENKKKLSNDGKGLT